MGALGHVLEHAFAPAVCLMRWGSAGAARHRPAVALGCGLASVPEVVAVVETGSRAGVEVIAAPPSPYSSAPASPSLTTATCLSRSDLRKLYWRWPYWQVGPNHDGVGAARQPLRLGRSSGRSVRAGALPTCQSARWRRTSCERRCYLRPGRLPISQRPSGSIAWWQTCRAGATRPCQSGRRSLTTMVCHPR